MRVAFIGLGRLGAALAGSLARAGVDLVVYDVDPAATRRLAELGAATGTSPAHVARGADVAITCLPSPTASAEVLAGNTGILTTLDSAGTWIEMSTTGKADTLRLAELAAARGVGTLEAPVTGGVHLAAEGAVTVIVGGEPALAERHRSLFEAMGNRVFHVGPLGAAADLKVITNMLAFVHLAACGEALMLARRAGLDLARAYEVMTASSGTSFVLETEGQVILNGSYDIGFTVDLALKDLGFALALGRETDVPLVLAEQVEAAFHRARERYGGSAWSPEVVRLLEDEVGVDLRAPGFPSALGPA